MALLDATLTQLLKAVSSVLPWPPEIGKYRWHPLHGQRLRAWRSGRRGAATIDVEVQPGLILLGAIDHGRDAALDTGQIGRDPAMALVVDLVGRRAMEIWGQVGA